MTFKAFREIRGLSLRAAAEQLGLRSMGHLSDMECGKKTWPIRLALEVEVWSGGQVTALELLTGADRALLQASLARRQAQLEVVG